jgi:exopolysaccharide biosynthesis polyprenyl glycosylphosphotransferase
VAESPSVHEQVQVTRSRRLRVSAVTDWTTAYLRQLIILDVCCGLAAGLLAFQIRFGQEEYAASAYLWLAIALPVLWVVALELAGAYDVRFIGVGSDEFRRVINAGISLTAAVAVLSYATKTDLARGYVVLALPCMTVFDLLGRYRCRKRLHSLRSRGKCMRKVVVVGHSDVIVQLTTVLRRQTYHGLSVVAACVVGPEADYQAIEGIPTLVGVGSIVDVVEGCQADTVAVLACPEMIGARLRDLAWTLEKTGTDLCVAPALLDVAGPRTTIRPVAGLPLLHMDHPEFTGMRWLVKSGFDRVSAAFALMLMMPLLAMIGLAIKIDDGGPVFFRQVRVGRDGRHFKLYKFRTMVVDAEQRKTELIEQNDGHGLLFKMRSDPRVTRVGARLRRYSLDELPQLLNVLVGDMSLVGPRPALPEEAIKYADYVRRRLVVKPGITGLWQVSGRSNLSWDEAVRLDVSYVENSSFVLDLQILWKTWAAVVRGDGAY